MGIYKLLAKQQLLQCLHFSQGQLNPPGPVLWEMPEARLYGEGNCFRASPSEGEQSGCGITKHRADNAVGEGGIICHQQSLGHWHKAERCLSFSILPDHLGFSPQTHMRGVSAGADGAAEVSYRQNQELGMIYQRQSHWHGQLCLPPPSHSCHGQHFSLPHVHVGAGQLTAAAAGVFTAASASCDGK